MDPTANAADLLESFVSGVQQRLMADVPVGIVLSGGLDSSLVAAVAHEAAERRPARPRMLTVAESEDNPDWQAAEVVASHHDLVTISTCLKRLRSKALTQTRLARGRRRRDGHVLPPAV